MDIDEPPKDCPRCGSPIVQPDRGRRRRWCSDDCRRRGSERGIRIREVVREKEVRRPERISVERQIARLLDDPDATELLLRTLAHRWRHDVPDAEARRRLKPTILDVWQAFHAAADPGAAKNQPVCIPTAAAEHRAAVERVLSSPRSIRTVLMRVRDMLDAGEFRASAADPVHSGIAYLFRQRTPPRHQQFYRARGN
ncbi:hypothetical protein REK76_29365 (plasmid) [Nocardia farcinica]|uniref:hypothetical protein n=1 Tax=Nocardia farcinica TaxID=37329 RepID=UPI001892E573|nr:hypothetical protein [Nocardia farcinica]MBF6284496.1 hypothetical protein [Nocardia farcinica]